MDLEKYQGKKFKAQVEGQEGGFSGFVEVSPEGQPLSPGQKIDFIVADRKGDEFVYDSRLTDQRTYEFRVTSVDLQQRILFVKLVQPPIVELRKNLDDLATRLQGIRDIQTIDVASAELLEKLAGYVPADDRQREIIEKYLDALGTTMDVAKKRYLDHQQKTEKLKLWTNAMTIERATEDQMPRLREMAGSFLRRTTLKPFDFEAHLRDFDHRMDKTLVGLLGGEIVAMASYNQRSDLDSSDNYPSDMNLIEFMGLSEFQPDFGKVFLKKIVPQVPLNSIYVVLWQHANHEFFRTMGFQEGEITSVAKRGHRGKANIHRYYTFNPGE